MLRLVKAIGASTINFSVDPDAMFEPGMIAQLKVSRDDFEIKAGVSNGTSPLGLIDDVKNEFDNTTLGSGRVIVWLGKAIWITDQFDTSRPYPLNANLYCGFDGRLTTFPTGAVVGMILNPPSANNALLEFLWTR